MRYWGKFEPAAGLTVWLLATDSGLCGLDFRDQAWPCARNESARWIREAMDQLHAYFGGRLQRFELPLALEGTPFQLRVWKALESIPYGETRSYAQIAAAIGEPRAVRAVGAANGRNPIAIVVPCHRVIGSNGQLTGYGGGLPIKKLLLELEARYAGGIREAATR